MSEGWIRLGWYIVGVITGIGIGKGLFKKVLVVKEYFVEQKGEWIKKEAERYRE